MFVLWSLPIFFSYQLRHHALETGIILHGKKSSWWDFIKAKWSLKKSASLQWSVVDLPWDPMFEQVNL